MPAGACWAEAASSAAGEEASGRAESGQDPRQVAAAKAILDHETSPGHRAGQAVKRWATGATAAAAAGVAGYYGVSAEAQLALSFDGGNTVAPYLMLGKELTRSLVASAGAAFVGLAVVPLATSWWRGTRFARAAEFYRQSSGSNPPRGHSPTTLAALVLAGSFAVASGAGMVVKQIEPEWLKRPIAYVQAQVASRMDTTRIVLAKIERVPNAQAEPPARPPRAVDPEASPIEKLAAGLRDSAHKHFDAAHTAVADATRAFATRLAKDTPLEGAVAAVLVKERYVPRGGVSASAGALLLLGAAVGSGAALTGFRRRFAETQYRQAVGQTLQLLRAQASVKRAAP